MKKNFKKSLAVFMAVLMLLSVVGVVAYAATYTLTFNAGTYGNEKTLTHSIVADGNSTVTLPDAMYTREGYVQTGWTTSKSGSGSVTSSTYIGNVGATYKVTRNRTIYPYWTVLSFDVTFAPGADAVGTAQTVEVDYNKTTKFPGAIFTREGYVQTGWSTVDGGEQEFTLTQSTPKITEDVTYYPVFVKCDYTVSVNSDYINFGSLCVDYATPAAETVVITNEGNMTLTYTLPSNDAYNISVVSGSLALAPGKTVSISVQPKAALSAANYTSDLVFDCDYDKSDITVSAMFIVNEHSFDKYVSDGNATYEADGTKSAECSNGCGMVDIVIDLGSMKVYSADNNTVEGLLEEYIYHKTVRVTVYGSGTDNIQEDGTIAEGTKRFLPVSWYVNEEFNGEFTDGNYDINFVHTSFGEYNLTVKYVEQEYVDGEWVATGTEDEKSFEYYVGPSAKEEQEVVRPNMIVSIIFALFAKIADLFGGLFS